MRERIQAVFQELDPEHKEGFRGLPWSFSAPYMRTQRNTSDCGVYLAQWALMQLDGRLPFVSEQERHPRDEALLGAEAPEF
ncbi:hypothetical protein L596_022684 [Steinernema carpocapsae]|uniref:Uncharacterized protein n=1 Tax=Steinernema carpocapsae TaxID=34508 RepID=A0A4V6A0B1_STECR|nr:hypothetical protein L596_022684 [Steinernema carpocapsae]